MINNQFPGPLVQANWGDTIHINVINNIDDEGTSLHMHGLPQKLTPWYDGVPSVQQCPIAPGGGFTYTFRAEVYGTSWYYSHHSAQYADGVFGPIVIYGFSILYPGALYTELIKRNRPTQASYDIDLGPILLVSPHPHHRASFSCLDVHATF